MFIAALLANCLAYTHTHDLGLVPICEVVAVCVVD